MIVFEKCDPDVRTCKSQEVINEWVEYKYLVTFQNTKNFIQHEFFEKRINAKSQFVWQTLSPTSRLDHVRTATRKSLNLHDYQYNFGNILLDEEDGFQIEETASARTLPYKNQYWNAITYELSLTRLEYTRTVYSFMDFLRDLGGLFGAISPIFGFIVSVF